MSREFKLLSGLKGEEAGPPRGEVFKSGDMGG
jgi:hypothetical protein